ncbi:MAG: hypothetical protein QFX36_04020 [Archaeoglobales archaeon]|nr:hypothetical protein [Archaeoglobales archaeon]
MAGTPIGSIGGGISQALAQTNQAVQAVQKTFGTVSAQAVQTVQQIAQQTGKSAEQVAQQIKAVFGTIPTAGMTIDISKLPAMATEEIAKLTAQIPIKVEQAVKKAEEMAKQIPTQGILSPVAVPLGVISQIPQKIETPKIELPKIEIPKVELPKGSLETATAVAGTMASAPVVGIPSIPKIELPKIEIPEPIAKAPETLWQGVGKLIEARDKAYEIGDLGKIAPAMAMDIVLPLDLAKAVQTGGKSIKNPADPFFIGADVIGLIPVIGWGAKGVLKGVASGLKITAKTAEAIEGIKPIAKLTKSAEAIEGAKTTRIGKADIIEIGKATKTTKTVESSKLVRVANRLENIAESIKVPAKLSAVGSVSLMAIGGAYTIAEALKGEQDQGKDQGGDDGKDQGGQEQQIIQYIPYPIEQPVIYTVEQPTLYPIEVPTTYYYPVESTAPIGYDGGYGYEGGLYGEEGEGYERGETAYSPSLLKRFIAYLDEKTGGNGLLVLIGLGVLGSYVGYRYLKKKKIGG